MSATRSDRRRRVPSVDGLLRSDPGRRAAASLSRPLLKHWLQITLEEVRSSVAGGAEPPEDEVILARAAERAALTFSGIGEVVNATGVLLHTGLGRAPLPPGAAGAAAAAARGYADLEVDRETGARGRRTSRAETMLKALTGAEDALVVNNNAAALVLALSALARRKEVLVSRGELIEIGGEFRLPDIMTASGAKLVEVGTTNRTRAADFRRSVGPRTGLILKVHPSNYRVIGFTGSVGLGELAAIAREAEIPLLYDLGSGLLERYPGVPEEEPAVSEALAGGADLVAFSGDKLLGGPQAGILAGRADMVSRLRRDPLARALRVDKMTVAALESVLRLYLIGRREEIPLWAMFAEGQRALGQRARGLATELPGAAVRREPAVIGGGSLPGFGLPSAQLVVRVGEPERLAARLRVGRPPVFCRVDDDALIFDLRTVPAELDPTLLRAIRYALEQDAPP